MNHTAPVHDSAIRPIALDRLAIAPENVRKTPPDAAADAELKASIAAHGLLGNLVVRSNGPGGNYAVVAGGRRLAALNALASDGALDAAHPVPCLVVDGDAPSAELSLAENVVRIAMHPADQVAAFRDLAESGSTVSSIAARFGISERLVEQRLRLGNAAPELLDAYRAGTIDLETLKGFAVTTDHRRQTAVWEQVSNQGYRPHRLAGETAPHPGPGAGQLRPGALRGGRRLRGRGRSGVAGTSSRTRTTAASGWRTRCC